MPDTKFWKERFNHLGIHSVGPGNTMTEDELYAHKQIFLQGIEPWLALLKGPVLDFGCGVGRWVVDLPRPYLGLDLLPEHIQLCNKTYGMHADVKFKNSEKITHLPDKSFKSIFTCTVLQHIVEKELRQNAIAQFHRLLSDDGILLSVEWAMGQWEADWCTGLGNKDFHKWFRSQAVGEIVENGRRHTIWLCKKKISVLSKFQDLFK
jgi:SAM-dependent methyltransferase